MSIELLEQEFGRWITPDQQAGLAPPENLYDASGMPLPYFQEKGGPRQFRSADGQAYAPSETPLRGLSSPTLPPLPNAVGTPFPPRQPNHIQIPMELRGRTGEAPRGPGLDRPGLDMPESAYPDAGPQNLLPGRGMGTHPVIPIPPAPTNRIRVPSEAQERVGLQSNAQRAIGDTVARQAITNRALNTALYPNGGSTTPTPQSQGSAPSRNNNRHPMDTTFQDVIRRPGATIRDMLEAGGFDWFGNRTQAQPETPVTDLRGRTGNTQRVSQWGDAPNYNLSTVDGLTEFNERMGLTLGWQVRTQAEQDRLFNNHQTPTRDSYHITGEAFDVPPRFIGGLTGENAVNAVLTRMQQARYNVDDYEVKWETGVGDNQGTGAHVHVEPRRRRRS